MALTDDDSAVDSLPVALVGTVILLAVIVALAAFGVWNATPSVATASVDCQVNAMANDCRFLLALAPRPMDDPGAPPGATRIEWLDLPESLEYLSFGSDPEAEDGSHEGTIYYKVGGSKKAIVVDERARFRAADGSHTILLSGRYDVYIEYVCDAIGHRYLLLSGLIRN
jgi:hypothetical protein